MPRAEVIETGPGDDPELLDAVREIYESSFPPSERGDFGELREAWQGGARRLFVAVREGRAVGFGATRPLDDARVQVLDYLAVADGERDGGVGGDLLDRLVERLRESGEGGGLLLEVEHPEDGPAEERALRERRVGFYRRHGARVVDCAPEYRAPRFDGPGSLRYLLMWIPLAEGAEPPAGEPLRSAVTALLVDGYELAPGDPLVGDVLEALAC